VVGVGVDAQGFSGTPRLAVEEYGVDRYVPRLVSLLDELGVERAALMGHSWGGVIVCYLAAAEPAG
jgi:pimeloyl-ACP methyl ester carboxylesterase